MRQDLDQHIIDAWSNLETRALTANPYSSPDFVLPALEHLTPASNVIFLLVESGRLHAPRLHALGVFEQQGPSTAFPLRSLSSYFSLHTFLGGMMVDNEAPGQALAAFFDFLAKHSEDWHAVKFTHRPADGTFSAMRDVTAADTGLQWHELETFDRPILRPNLAGEEFLRTKLRSRNKDCQRLLRQLAATGKKVEWRFLRGDQITDANIVRFLELENMGWKRARGTSLVSHQSENRFFIEMMTRFRRRGQVFMTELCLDGQAIASTTNLISRGIGFAFKIGWDNQYAHYAPGILNEVEFIRNAPQVCPDLEYIDSGTLPGTFIDKLWLDRRKLATGMYPTTTLGEKALTAMKVIRRLTR